ncbi:PREDICTED: uncharacterized protein LOC109580494 isoform X2 [Amphimedon queenslandica]|uniref:Uncharacterized protein n=1 Tax=Amphimedon queenslandica TaxID=400682 RepID=A0A1X7VFY6_AMPQE|nr:PREDICTED: uncharacterized protein LOC109580494 isoform X2 [Amphimedon queenslandica]|eukprot:XP_019849299.1 PREDICTED: uncharacterized protein LOC109580494 isoform X2 [Amphimedon queenslandica]
MDSELLTTENSEQEKSSPQPDQPPEHQPPQKTQTEGTDTTTSKDPPSPQYRDEKIGTNQDSEPTVIIATQPGPTVINARIEKSGDYYLTLSIILTVICCCCGIWDSLFCTIPAIFFASAARDAESRGEYDKAISRGRVAFFLNIAACVWWLITVIIIVIAAVTSALTNN